MPGTPTPQISLITLAVANVAAATRFYEKLGFRHSEKASVEGEVSFFALSSGLVLALYDREDYRRDADLVEAPGRGGIMLARNLPSPLAVDRFVAAFVAAGGRLQKAPEKTHWGGYCGYLADPDGHLWEIAHNPHWPLSDEGLVTLPE
jgi:predicted lactoylglutathione lyase